jgi:hypothetical protein
MKHHHSIHHYFKSPADFAGEIESERLISALCSMASWRFDERCQESVVAS